MENRIWFPIEILFLLIYSPKYIITNWNTKQYCTKKQFSVYIVVCRYIPIRFVIFFSITCQTFFHFPLRSFSISFFRSIYIILIDITWRAFFCFLRTASVIIFTVYKIKNFYANYLYMQLLQTRNFFLNGRKVLLY